MIIEVSKISDPAMLDYLQFICRAVAVESGRYALDRVLVADGCFVATDGVRMHIVNTKHDYEHGLYRIVENNDRVVVLLKAKVQGKFPEWRDVIPKHKDYFTVNDNEYIDSLDTIAAFGLAQKGIASRLNNLHDAMGEHGVWDIYFGTPHEPIMCTYGDKQALLMPVKTPPDIEFKVKK